MFEFGLSDDIIPKGILLFLFPKEHHSSSSSSYLSSVSPRLIYFAILSQKQDHGTACLPTCYTLIVFKNGAPHTEVVYAHQTNLFRSLQTRGKRIFPFFLSFCSKDQTKLCAHDKNSKRADLGKN